MKAMTETTLISREAIVSLVGQLTGGYPDPDNPSPPGPWDPVIRRAWERFRVAFNPGPEPWAWVALNPQPLPPRAAIVVSVVREVSDRAALLHEVAGALPSDGGERGIIIVGGYVSRFIEDCGNGRVKFKPPVPFPRPPRGDEEGDPLTGLDLVIMGVQFQREAAVTADEQLREVLAGAGAKLVDMGAARL